MFQAKIDSLLGELGRSEKDMFWVSTLTSGFFLLIATVLFLLQLDEDGKGFAIILLLVPFLLKLIMRGRPRQEVVGGDLEGGVECSKEKNGQEYRAPSANQVLQGLYSALMLLSIAGYSFLWSIYALTRGQEEPHGYWLDVCSVAAVAFAVLLFLVASVLTWISLEFKPSSEFRNLSKLQQAVSLYPYRSLGFFVSIFLCVAYVFSFAFAFHDHSYNRQVNTDRTFKRWALYSPASLALNLSEPPTSANSLVVERLDLGSSDISQDPPVAASNSDGAEPLGPLGEAPGREAELEVMVFFEEGETTVEFDEEQVVNQILSGSSESEAGSSGKSDFSLPDLESEEDIRRHYRTAMNSQALTRIVTLLHGRRNSEPIEVQLIGHASSKRPSSGSIDNQQRSVVRAEEVREVIRRLLTLTEKTLYEITYEPRGRGDVEHFSIGEVGKGLKAAFESGKLERRLSVEVMIRDGVRDPKEIKEREWADNDLLTEVSKKLDEFQQNEEQRLGELETMLSTLAKSYDDVQGIRRAFYDRGRKLNLIEYLYFTIYTITTTGYGDIVPITAYAKMLSSVVNIFELFFLVMFFNALLASAKGRDELGAKGRANRRTNSSLRDSNKDLENKLTDTIEGLKGVENLLAEYVPVARNLKRQLDDMRRDEKK